MKIKGTISPKYGHSGCKDFDVEFEIPDNTDKIVELLRDIKDLLIKIEKIEAYRR